jgi:hypothetical protein
MHNATEGRLKATFDRGPTVAENIERPAQACDVAAMAFAATPIAIPKAENTPGQAFNSC